MIPSFTSHNPNPSFPITRIILLSLALLFLFSNLSLSLSKSSNQFNPTKINTMPTKRNLTDLSDSDPLTLPMSNNVTKKKLRRLPHIFSKVLELPFHSDADVSIEERNGCLRFVAKTDYDLGEVRAHMVEVYPGVKKVVIRKRENESHARLINEMELDVWRFRLPEASRLELAKAVYGGGTLVVTVPKSDGGSGSGGHGCNEGLRDGVGNLVLVQGIVDLFVAVAEMKA